MGLITGVKIPFNLVIRQFITFSLLFNSLEQTFLLRSRSNKDADRRHTNFITANALAATFDTKKYVVFTGDVIEADCVLCEL